MTTVTVNDQGHLICPKCKGEWLHHVRVEVFDRREDEEGETHIVVNTFENREIFQASGAPSIGNPSSRRGGVALWFDCETCKATPVLTFAQHKGLTVTEWKDAPL